MKMEDRAGDLHYITLQLVLTGNLYDRQPHMLTLEDMQRGLLKLKAETEKALAAVAKAQEVRV